MEREEGAEHGEAAPLPEQRRGHAAGGGGLLAELAGGNAINGSRGDEERSKRAEYIGALSARGLGRAGRMEYGSGLGVKGVG